METVFDVFIKNLNVFLLHFSLTKKTTIILIFIKTQSMTKETNAKKAQKMLSSYELWKFPFETFLKLEVKWLMQDIPLSLMILYDIVYCTIKGPKLLID